MYICRVFLKMSPIILLHPTAHIRSYMCKSVFTYVYTYIHIYIYIYVYVYLPDLMNH